MGCTGNGQCFYQIEQDEYAQNDCIHKCKLIDCPNKPLCKSKDPKWLYDCHMGRCLNCNMFLNQDLEFKQGACAVCQSNSTLAKLPCGDWICCSCFRGLLNLDSDRKRWII